jgi:hypothetical protein
MGTPTDTYPEPPTEAARSRSRERVVVCGSRGWTDLATIARRIGELPDDSIVIHGGAKGADSMAGQAATLRGLHVAVVYPLWEHYGKSAGHRRNATMLDLEPHRVIAFTLGTGGTQGTIDDARRRGIPVEVVGTEAH